MESEEGEDQRKHLSLPGWICQKPLDHSHDDDEDEDDDGSRVEDINDSTGVSAAVSLSKVTTAAAAAVSCQVKFSVSSQNTSTSSVSFFINRSDSSTWSDEAAAETDVKNSRADNERTGNQTQLGIQKKKTNLKILPHYHLC